MNKAIDHNLSTLPQAISYINEHLTSINGNIANLQQNVGSLNNNLRPIATQECEKVVSTLNYNETFDKMLSVTENTIATSSTSIAHVDSIIVWYLGFVTLILALATIGMQIYFNKSKIEKIQEATADILKQISENAEMRSNLIQEILKDKEFQDRFSNLIKEHTNQQENKNQFYKNTFLTDEELAQREKIREFFKNRMKK